MFCVISLCNIAVPTDWPQCASSTIIELDLVAATLTDFEFYELKIFIINKQNYLKYSRYLLIKLNEFKKNFI